MSVYTLRIDGADVAGAAGQSILDVAAENGIEIPTLCHLEGLSDVGACRLCVVEVGASGKLLPACVTAVEEGMEVLLRDPEILSPRVRSTAGINREEGIGIAEAPRGTLLHHYRVDRDGIVQWANLIIATGHNNLAMNRSVAQVARHDVKADRLTEPMLNRVEAVIRCYDPCLSCSTHAIGQMPLHLQLLAPDGSVLDECKR